MVLLHGTEDYIRIPYPSYPGVYQYEEKMRALTRVINIFVG